MNSVQHVWHYEGEKLIDTLQEYPASNHGDIAMISLADATQKRLVTACLSFEAFYGRKHSVCASKENVLRALDNSACEHHGGRECAVYSYPYGCRNHMDQKPPEHCLFPDHQVDVVNIDYKKHASAWPIVAFTYLVVREKTMQSCRKLRLLRELVEWMLQNDTAHEQVCRAHAAEDVSLVHAGCICTAGSDVWLCSHWRKYHS